MQRRRADRARIGLDVVEADAAALVQAHSQQTAPLRRRADALALLGADAGGDELQDLAVLVDHRDRAVARVEQLGGLVDHLLEQGVE